MVAYISKGESGVMQIDVDVVAKKYKYAGGDMVSVWRVS
jgi:hypothetical protein